MRQFGFNGKNKEIKRLLQKLSPMFELTSHIRPRLLLAALPVDAKPIVFGLLYHTERKAFRSCLRFGLARQPEFVRCTRWKPWANRASIAARYTTILQGFDSVASQLGTHDVLRLDFAARATDTEILTALFASPIASVVMEESV